MYPGKCLGWGCGNNRNPPNGRHERAPAGAWTPRHDLVQRMSRKYAAAPLCQGDICPAHERKEQPNGRPNIPGRGMMKWMIAGKLSLHDGCHYINPDHADHKDPIVWLQTRPQRVVDLFFNHPKSSATSRSTEDGNKMRDDIFTPPSSGIPHDFMRSGNKNGAIWRHVRRGYGCVRNAFRAPLQTEPALRLVQGRARSVTQVSSRPDSSAASSSCQHTSAAGHAAHASPAARPQATDRRSTAPRRRGGDRRSGTGWASRWPSRRP